jgi:hypothetical protein
VHTFTLQKIQRAVDERMTVARNIGSEDSDLAVRDLARRTSVLPRHSTGRLARAHGRRERQNIGRRRDIGILAWGQMQDERPAERIAQRMGFCRAASARAADCLIVLPPFPPEAHR